MADFCSQCSITHFSEDFGDLKGLGNGKELVPDYGWPCLCEGCGPTIVNDQGQCISEHCLKQHGKKNKI